MSTLEGKHFNRTATIYWVLNISNLINEKIEAYKNVTKMTQHLTELQCKSIILYKNYISYYYNR